jgi:hypothetical protein
MEKERCLFRASLINNWNTEPEFNPLYKLNNKELPHTFGIFTLNLCPDREAHEKIT